MEDLDFTLLEENQIFGENRLSIFKEYETRAAITDFAILLGGYVSDDYYTNEGNDLKDRTGWWWTKTDDGDNDVRVVDSSGDSLWSRVSLRSGGARPALPYSLIQSIASSVVRSANEIKEVEYGEYPQTIVNESLSNELEKLYNENKLQQTGKNYTTDSAKYIAFNTSFKARTHSEYEYNGEKYIRFVGDSNCAREVLSDGRRVHFGNVYWVCVEPITWLVDERANIVLSKKIIFSGVQFNYIKNYKGDFDKTDMHCFLKNYFSKDIMPSKIENIKEESKEVVLNEKDNMEIVPYLVKYENSDESFGAYELDGILRDIITSLQIVNKSSRKSKGVLKCASKEKTTFKVLSSYCLDMNERERLEYALKISELGKNEILHKMYLDQIEAEYKEKVIEHVRSLQLKR